ncbi:MAG: GNAT family N-acetyltransferase [Halobacteriota archaeon]
MPGPPFRRGDPVDLCPIEAEDLPFLQRNYNDPVVRRWMPAAHPTNGHQFESDFEDWPEDDVVRLLGCVDDDPVGMISLFAVEEDSGRAMLGAWIDPEHQGNGYGRSMTAQMVDYAFAERRLHRLTANALATNEPSRATLESVGFEQEGRQREAYFVDGEYVDRVIYGLLRTDWDGV